METRPLTPPSAAFRLEVQCAHFGAAVFPSFGSLCSARWVLCENVSLWEPSAIAARPFASDSPQCPPRVYGLSFPTQYSLVESVEYSQQKVTSRCQHEQLHLLSMTEEESAETGAGLRLLLTLCYLQWQPYIFWDKALWCLWVDLKKPTGFIDICC